MRRDDRSLRRPASRRAGAFHVPLAAMLVLAAWAGGARAQQIVVPPPIYPADTWQGRSIATVRVLDTLDSSVQVLTIPVGQDAAFRALTIHVGACRDRPPTLAPDAAGWLTVRDTRQDGPGFDGWMLAGEPFLGVFQDPVYAVRLIGCAGDPVAPVPPPLAVLAAATAVPGDQAAGAQGGGAPVSGPSPLAAPGSSSPAAPGSSSPAASGPALPAAPAASPAGQPVIVPAAPVRAPALRGAPLSLSPPDDSASVAPPAQSRPQPLSQPQPGQPQSLLPP
ncbi:DUF2155 domain-containing protein [Gluconacetobacter sacchari]